MKELIIKKRYLIAAIFIAIILIADFLLGRIYPKTEEAQPNLNSFDEVSPGKTTEGELTRLLGEPISIDEEKNYKIFSYPSNIENYPSNVYITNNIVGLVIQPLSASQKVSLEKYTEMYGDPQRIIYIDNLGPSYPGYVFEDDGFIVFAHKNTMNVLEIWHVPTENMTEILNSVDKNLLDEYLMEPDSFPSEEQQP